MTNLNSTTSDIAKLLVVYDGVLVRWIMATIPQIEAARPQMSDEAAAKIAALIEEHFDEQGLSEEERNRRVSKANTRVAAAVAHHSKSA